LSNYNKQYYDSKHIIYQPGDYAMIRNFESKLGESSKFKPNYKGSDIVHALNKNMSCKTYL